MSDTDPMPTRAEARAQAKADAAAADAANEQANHGHDAETAAPTDAEAAAAAQADEADKREAEKAKRAEAGVTAAANGDPGATAFGPRIEQAKFDHRNQGHDDTLGLLDEMLAGIQRLEAKLAGAI